MVGRPQSDPGLEICSVDLGIGLARPDLDLGHLEIGDAVSEQARTEIDPDHLDPDHLEIVQEMFGLARTVIDLAHLAPGHLEIGEGMLEQVQTVIDLDLDLLDRYGLKPTGLERLGS